MKLNPISIKILEVLLFTLRCLIRARSDERIVKITVWADCTKERFMATKIILKILLALGKLVTMCILIITAHSNIVDSLMNYPKKIV